MTCPRCGRVWHEDSRFCIHCGAERPVAARPVSVDPGGFPARVTMEMGEAAGVAFAITVEANGDGSILCRMPAGPKPAWQPIDERDVEDLEILVDNVRLMVERLRREGRIRRIPVRKR